VVRELVQESDGTLSVKVPASIDQTFHEKVPYEFQPGWRRPAPAGLRPVGHSIGS
jgi:hypothetical protein